MSTAVNLQQADDLARDQLADLLRGLAGRPLAEVRITRTRWPDGLRWCVMVLCVDPRAPWGQREVPLAEGGHHHDIAILLRDAFPHANWSVAQDYDVVTGALTEHRTALPACLRGDHL